MFPCMTQLLYNFSNNDSQTTVISLAKHWSVTHDITAAKMVFQNKTANTLLIIITNYSHAN